VNLLQKDKAVVKYFSSLQENLEADVQKWKDQARYFEALYKSRQNNKGNEDDGDDHTEEMGTRARARSEKSPSQKKGQKQSTDAKSKKTATQAKTKRKNGAGEPKNDSERLNKINAGRSKKSSLNNKNKESASLEDTYDNEILDASSDNGLGTGPPEIINIQKTGKDHEHGEEAGDKDGLDIEDSMFQFESDSSNHGDNNDDHPEEHKEQPKASTTNKDNSAFAIYSSDDDDAAKQQQGDNGNPEPIKDADFEFCSSDDDDDDDSVDKDKAKEKTPKPIKDTDFEFCSSDDGDGSNDDDSEQESHKPIKEINCQFRSPDDDDGKDRQPKQQYGPTVKATLPSSLNPPPLLKKNKEFILSELVDAYQCLHHLGIVLVDKVEITHCNDAEATETGEPARMADSDSPKGTANLNGASDNEEDCSPGAAEEEDGISFLPGDSETQALKRQFAEAETSEIKKFHYHRRADEDVVKDMLNIVRRLTQLDVQYSDLPAEFQSFRFSPLWIPCGDRVPSMDHSVTPSDSGNDENHADDAAHPARVGKICLFRALSVMDTFCAPECLHLCPRFIESFDPWGYLFEGNMEQELDTDSMKTIQYGMRDRKDMVENLVESLAGEMSEHWAVADRADRITREHLFYKEEIETDVTTHEALGEDDNTRQPSESFALVNGDREQKLLSQPVSSKASVSTLAERRILAQIVVSLYFARDDPEQAFQLVCQYILSTIPSIAIEEYPRLQPVFSLVVLEGMLLIDPDLADIFIGKDEEDEDAPNGIDSGALWFSNMLRTKAYLRKALSLCINSTASIWRQRLKSSNSRIAEISRLEIASYLRLIESNKSPWLELGANTGIKNEDTLDNQLAACTTLIQNFEHETSSAKNAASAEKNISHSGTSVALGLCLLHVLLGDHEKAKALFLTGLQELRQPFLDASYSKSVFRTACWASSVALRQLEIRQLEMHRRKIGSLGPNAWASATERNLAKSRTACITELRDFLKTQVDTITQTGAETRHMSSIWSLAATLLHCCSLASAGDVAYETVDLLLDLDNSMAEKKNSYSGPPFLFETLESVALIPVVRVVNLKRRADRMTAMMSQAIQSNVLVMRGVARLHESDIPQPDEPSHFTFYGGYAIDGNLKRDDLVHKLFPSGGRLQDNVSPRWRPHDLKAFDRKANNDEHALVWISESERACALSHIATWKGVLRSLSDSVTDADKASSGMPKQTRTG